jgi:D-alanine-D-alanine ligase
MGTPFRRFRRVCVLTGDHRLPDSTKPGSQYGQLDLAYQKAMEASLGSLAGYDFDFLSDHEALLARLLEDPPEFVLNLCDTGFRNAATRELHVPALLELLGIPYSGATPACIALCYDKGLVRLVAESLGVATPREMLVHHDEDLDVLSDFEYPALVKPNRADGSVGITRDSVVVDAAQAAKYVERLRRELAGGDVLVQEYLPGAEYGFALIGNPGCGFTALPALEVDYSALPSELPPILGYESKTDPDSAYWRSIKLKAAQLAPEVLEAIRQSAVRLFERLQCQDYARFDLRSRADGQIALMEVNPNPAWDPDAKLARMAALAGKSYPQMFEMILEAAQARLARAQE